MACQTLQLGSLLKNDKFDHRTCGMHPSLVAALRLAYNSSNRKLALKKECDRILSQLKQIIKDISNIVVAVGPPIGNSVGIAINGDISTSPALVVWLLLDTIDIDSKQTTFLDKCTPSSAAIFDMLYKLPYPENSKSEHAADCEKPSVPPRQLSSSTSTQAVHDVPDLISTIIANKVYLGPYFFRQRTIKDAFRNISLKSIVNCDPHLPMMLAECDCTRIEIEDCAPPAGNVVESLRQAATAIAAHHAPVYVHCSEGVGRSPSCVTAYLVQERHQTVKEALAHVQSCRPCACPHPGYVRALLDIEAETRASGSEHTPSVDMSLYELYYDTDRTVACANESFAQWLDAAPPVPPARQPTVGATSPTTVGTTAGCTLYS